MLKGHEYLIGYRFTFIDLRAFMCLIRFDPCYVLVFKCNKRTISSYKNLSRYIRHLYHDIGHGKHIDMEQMKNGYSGLVENYPRRIVALAPDPRYEIVNE